MFNDFFNKLKTNLLHFKNNLLFFFRLVRLTFLLNIFYFFIIYSYLIQLGNNIVPYSFINNFFLIINVNYSLFLFIVFYLSLSLKSLLIKKVQNMSNFRKNKFLINSRENKKNFNNILLSLNYYTLNLEFIKSTLSYVCSLYFFYIKYTFNNLFLTNYILFVASKLTTKISWYPIFKRHSIFGYYRINRQRWVELKSEEINYIKY
jgi:hypothetical protein